MGSIKFNKDDLVTWADPTKVEVGYYQDIMSDVISDCKSRGWKGPFKVSFCDGKSVGIKNLEDKIYPSFFNIKYFELFVAKELKLGDICPKCNALFKKRELFLTSYEGCMC